MKISESKKYRDSLAKELKKLRKIDRKLAIIFLNKAKKTKKYQEARKISINQRRKS